MSDSAVERILQATAELIAEGGLTPLTMTAIAKRAGVSRQTLYLHYADTDRIVVDLLSRHADEVMQHLERLLGAVSGADARLEQLIRQTVSAEADHDPAVLAGALGPAARDVLETHLSQRRTVIARLLREGVESGTFRADLMIEGTAAVIDAQFGAVAAMVDSGMSLAEAADELCELTLRAVRG